jgi:type II secretory pathway component PulM
LKLLKRILLGLAVLTFLGLAYLRVFSPPRNVLEEAFRDEVASRVTEGKAAYVIFGDPKT